MAKVKGFGTDGVRVESIIALWSGDMRDSLHKESDDCFVTATSNNLMGIGGKVVKDFKDI